MLPPLPARLKKHLAPALAAYALALALLAAAALTGRQPLLAAATVTASTMLLFPFLSHALSAP